jgi:hypothetical protein
MYVRKISENSDSFTFSVFDELSSSGLWRSDSILEEVQSCSMFLKVVISIEIVGCSV